MKLGGPLFEKYESAEDWVRLVKELGYSAAYSPLQISKEEKISEADIRSYAQAAEKHQLIIAEVGAWSNPLSGDEQVGAEAVQHCQQSLALADEIGARCCVNIAGSLDQQWDGPHPDNLTEETFERIVDTVRKIIDEVQPRRTCYTLETMPWMYPDSVENYLRLIKAIDRPQFAAHLDPVNLISSPQRYYSNAALIKQCVQVLGPYIKSVHLKDIRLSGQLMVHLDEVRPGLGNLDYPTLLRQLNTLAADLPVMLEHLPNAQEYLLAATHIRQVAAEVGVPL